MFGLFKKKKKIETKFSYANIKATDVESYYFSILKITPWIEYTQLNKYEKVLAFTIEGIDDKSVLKDIFNTRHINQRKSSSFKTETKQKLKKLGIRLGHIDTLSIRYIHIGACIRKFVTMRQLMDSEYCRLSVLQTSTPISSDKEFDLHGILVKKDDPALNKWFPPNFFYDRTTITAIHRTGLKRREDEVKTFQDIDFNPEPDFDFNIPKYFLENYYRS